MQAKEITSATIAKEHATQITAKLFSKLVLRRHQLGFL